MSGETAGNCITNFRADYKKKNLTYPRNILFDRVCGGENHCDRVGDVPRWKYTKNFQKTTGTSGVCTVRSPERLPVIDEGTERFARAVLFFDLRPRVCQLACFSSKSVRREPPDGSR